MTSWITLHHIFLIIHILGTALGAGAAFTGDILFLRFVKKKLLSKDESQTLQVIGKIVWIGLFILLLSGIGLALERPEIFLHSGKFWAKMTVVAVLTINGLLFLLLHRPVIEKSVGKKFSPTSEIIQKRSGIVLSGAISVLSWNFVIILGVLGRTPFSYLQFLSTYLALLLCTCCIAYLLRKKILS